MESSLLYPDGRSTAISPLLGSVVPALLPRLSREELGHLVDAALVDAASVPWIAGRKAGREAA